jgi:tetratricopeptide (TPR) repeat protein
LFGQRGTVVTALWAAHRSEDARALPDQALPIRGRLTPPLSSPRPRSDADRRCCRALVLLDQAEQAGQDVALPRAEALSRLGPRREAIQTLESAIARHPADVELAFMLSGMLLAEGRPAQARAALDRVQPFLGTGGPRMRLVLAEAETYRAEGRYGRALDLVQTAVRLAPNDPGLHRQAAQLYEAMRRPGDALRSHHRRPDVRRPGRSSDGRVDGTPPRLRRGGEGEGTRSISRPGPAR